MDICRLLQAINRHLKICTGKMGTDVTRSKLSSKIHFWVSKYVWKSNCSGHQFHQRAENSGMNYLMEYTSLRILSLLHKTYPWFDLSLVIFIAYLQILLLWDLVISDIVETCLKTFILLIFVMVNFRLYLNQRDRGGESAGPGEYPIKGSVGKQPESQRATLPSYSFPQSTREGRDKVSVLLCTSF